MAEVDTKNLDALLSSLNKSAERLQALWFAFLSLSLYLAITFASTTHKSMLLKDDQVLPILNIKIPVVGFFVVSPILYFVIHVYFLLSLILLSRTSGAFNVQIDKSILKPVDREPYRARVENAIFLQLLIGQRQERVGLNSNIIFVVSFLTSVVFPAVILILCQLEFLPYHSVHITWMHRALVVVDVSMAILFWSSFRYAGGDVRGAVGMPGFRSVFFVVVCLWLSLWEGRWFGEPLIGKFYANEENFRILSDVFPTRIIISESHLLERDAWKVQKEINYSTNGRTGFITVDFSKRNFVGARFSNVDIRGARFSGAELRGAEFNQVYAALADFSGAKLQGVNIYNSDFTASGFAGSDFTGSHFLNSNITGAVFKGATLDGAEIFRTTAAGVDFRGASFLLSDILQANMNLSDFKGACIIGSNIVESSISGSDFTMSTIAASNLQGVVAIGINISSAIVASNLLDLRSASYFNAGFAADKSDQEAASCTLYGDITDLVSRGVLISSIRDNLSQFRRAGDSADESLLDGSKIIKILSGKKELGVLHQVIDNAVSIDGRKYIDILFRQFSEFLCGGPILDDIEFGAQYYAQILRIDSDNRAEENLPDPIEYAKNVLEIFTKAQNKKGGCGNAQITNRKTLESIKSHVENTKMRIDLMDGFDRTR